VAQFTNLTLLQLLCNKLRVGKPDALDGMTPEQEEVLRLLDESHRWFCGLADWWFLERTSYVRLVAGSVGVTTATVTSSVITAGASIFETAITGHDSLALSRNGKVVLSGSSPYGSDLLRVNATNATHATIITGYDRGNVSPAVNISYGQDEYALPADVDDVRQVRVFDLTGHESRHNKVWPASLEEIRSIRANRPDRIKLSQPTRYCVRAQDQDSTQHQRIVFDPFPDTDAAAWIMYKKKPNSLLDETGEVLVDVPVGYLASVVERAAASYYATIGMGAPAGSPAGQDYAERASTKTQVATMLAQRKQRATQRYRQLPSIEPSSTDRLFWSSQFGRNI